MSRFLYTHLVIVCAVAMGFFIFSVPAVHAQQAADQTCLECHEDQMLPTSNVHHRIMSFELVGGVRSGCEACHGPGGAHMEEGDPSKIFSFANATPEESSQACLTCHKSLQAMDFNLGDHATNEVGCSDCHSTHNESGLVKSDPELCMDCHRDIMAKVNFPSRHPLREGKMKCSSCHAHHGSMMQNLKTHERLNDMCINCHGDKQGPFIFEHAPVAEDCTICHDTLFNMDTASLARSGVFHEDYNPTDEYNINFSETNAKAKLQIPQISFVDFYAGVRNQHRSGQYQARTLSKCSTCHVVGKTRSINNNNTDYKLGTNVRVAKASFDYSYTVREYRENKAAPTNTYLTKLHPEASSPVFDSRIQYDSVDGALPFNVIPDTNKDTHLVKLSVPIADSSVLSGHYSSSRIENLMTNYKMDTSSIAAGFSMLVGRRGVFNVRVNRIKIRNDDVFVDTVEPVDVAGPYAGQTYAEAYPTFGSADWTRKSTYNRETIDFDTSFKYRFTSKTKARLTYEFKKIALMLHRGGLRSPFFFVLIIERVNQEAAAQLGLEPG